MRFTGRAAPVPVVSGPTPNSAACVACGVLAAGGAKVREVHDGNDLSLCFDFVACCHRYRGGGSPASYAELLAVSS